MKRNFLSLLMITVCATVVSMMVSCKDNKYDDTELRTQVATNTAAIATLQQMYSAGCVITKVEKTATGVTVTTSDGKTFEITNGADGKDADVWTIGTDGFWYRNGEKTGYYALGTKGDKGDAGVNGAAGKDGKDGKDGKNGVDGKDGKDGQNGKDGGYYLPKADGFFYFVKDGKETKTDISWVTSSVSAVQYDTYCLFKVPGSDKPVRISTVLELSSLVFIPTEYYQGIEALVSKGFTYFRKTVNNVTADGNYPNDAPSTASTSTTLTPGLTAQYHLNPANAYAKGYDYSFIYPQDKNYTRGASNIPVDVATANNGVLTVKAHVSYNFKDIEDDGKVSVIALQAANADTVITSDYAAVRAVNYSNLYLAFVNLGDFSQERKNNTPMYKTAQEALDTTAAAATITFPLVWNNDGGIDLARYVNTRYTPNGGVDQKWDNNANSGTVEQSGFKYNFELVGWHSGSNKTSESAHAALNPADISMVRAQMTAGGLQQPWGYTQNKATLGRQPLVRVTLTDTVCGQIAAVGYVRLNIVEKVVPPTPTEKSKVLFVEKFSIDNTPYTVACSNNVVASKKLLWHEVEEQIVARLGISHEEFATDYILDLNNETPSAQYSDTTVSANVVSGTGKEVKKLVNDPETGTDVLAWEICNQKAYEVFKSGSTKKITSIVRFNKTFLKGTSDEYHHYIYIYLEWTPTAINVKPEASIDNSCKITNYWYKGYSKDEGYDEIHGNVEVVGQTGADCEFRFNVLNTFVKNNVTIKFDNQSTYSGLGNLTNKTFKFVTPSETSLTGASGKTYTVSASSDGQYMTANGQNIAKITAVDATTVEIEFLDSENGKDLLNYASHTELAKNQTLTGKVSIDASLCDPVGKIAIKNNTFNVRFLRPIDITDPGETNFQDGETGGSEVNLVLKFWDWRGMEFTDSYFDYYGVTGIEADTKNITTTLNGGKLGTTKLSSITTKIDFTFTPPTTVTLEDQGKLKYQNNGVTVKDFKVRVPLAITYKWGKLYTHVDCNIKGTISNVKPNNLK